MFIVSLVFDKKKINPLEDLEQVLGSDWSKKVFESVVSNAVASVFGGHVGGVEGRILGSIFASLDASAPDRVGFERIEWEFLRDVFANPQCRTPIAQIRARLQIEAALRAAEEV